MASTDGFVYAYNVLSGKLLWKFRTPKESGPLGCAAPVCIGGAALAIRFDMNLRSGRQYLRTPAVQTLLDLLERSTDRVADSETES